MIYVIIREKFTMNISVIVENLRDTIRKISQSVGNRQNYRGKGRQEGRDKSYVQVSM